MESKKINQLATNVAPQTSDLTIIGDPTTGVSKKITLLQIANLFATTGTVSSVAVTESGDALTITGSPITTAGTINIGFAGDATQYVRGDGALADFPTSTGGGSSVSYYLNSSVSQGTIGGVAYRELSKDPISGAGTDITISANGYVASYITDANDPALLEVPGGNFNCEFYFSVNSNAHNPYVYAELYKYDGTTFTLLGSSQSVPEYLTNGTTLSPYYFAVPVATAALTITDRLAIRIYANVDTRTVTLHTENNHLCQVVTTFSKGLTSLNNLTRQVQFLATGTSGTDFAISSSTATHTFNLPIASATNTGKLSSTDWSTFNSKQAALSFTAPLVNTSNTISIPVATASVDGYLDNLDWTNFNTAYNNMIVSAAVTGTTTKTLTLTQQDAGTITASWTDDNTDAVTSVFGRTGAVVAVSGDYNTSQVTENTNLYFTDSRARLALSFVAGSGAYNSTTGVITIPTNTSQLTNGANYITLTSISSSATGLTYTNTTGAFSLTAGYSIPTNASQTTWDTAYTNRITGAFSPLNITSNQISIFEANTNTNGYITSADWNTFNGKQAALNGTGFVKATGTTISYDNSTYLTTSAAASTYLPLSGGTLTNASSSKLTITGGTTQNGISFNAAGNADAFYIFNGTYLSTAGFGIYNITNDAMPFFIFDNGNIGLSTATDNGSKLQVNGTATFSSSVTATSGNFTVDDAATNSVLDILTLTHTTSGTAASGLGAGILFRAERPSSGIVLNRGAIYGVSGTDPDDNGDLAFYTLTNTGASGFSEKMRIKGSGNVGIGTSSPNTWGTNLVVYNNQLTTTGGGYDGTFADSIFFGGNNEGTTYRNKISNSLSSVAANQKMKFSVANGVSTFADVMTLVGNGNVGIGTSSPSEKLDVIGGGLAAGNGTIRTGITYSTLGLIGTFTNHDLGIITNGNERIRITSGGLIYVNTTTGVTGGGTLQVNGNVNINGVFQINGTTIGGGGGSGVTGSGTNGNLTKWTGASTIGNSVLTDTGTRLIQNSGDGFVIATNASDTIGGGSFLALTNSGSTRWILQQINASFGLDWWSYNGSAWNTRMTLTAGGNLGLGTTTPTTYSLAGTHAEIFGGSTYAFLHINTTTVKSFIAINETALTASLFTFSNHALCLGTNNTERVRISPTNGNLLIGTQTDNGYKLYVSGTIYATGDVIAFSDVRIKTNIRPIKNVLERITNSRGVIYDRTDNDDKNNIGFIAQELEEQFPELVSTDNQGNKGVKYQNAVAVLFEAIKEQQKQIEELKILVYAITK